jgi:hypothetical protein
VRTYEHLVNIKCKCTTGSEESKEIREEFEESAALKWCKPTNVSACHLDIGESPLLVVILVNGMSR